jgi:GNAT superfamily N-acetyltransferase
VSKITSYHIKKVDDYCLRDNRWLELDWRLNSLTKLKQELDQAIIFAKKKSLAKIEIVLPAKAEEFSDFLVNKYFKPALSELKINLEETTDLPWTIADLSFVTKIDNKQLVKELLVEQANFHYQSLPDYYRSPLEINWFFYLKQVCGDAQKENGLIVLAKDQEQAIALVLGEHLAKTAFIWEVIVSQKKRNFHLGTLLLKRYLQKLKTQGVSRVYLETISQSYAKKWYEHQGFKTISQSWFCRLK